MNLFRRHLKPAWTFRSEKRVWRLLPGNGVLVAELRDTDKKTTEFAGVELTSGSLLWKNTQLEDKWWIFLNKIHKDVLFLHQFVKPDMPTPGNIFALDLFTGKLLWQNRELSYLNSVGDLVYGIRRTIISEEIVGLHYRTGQSQENFPTDDPRTQEINVSKVEEGFTLPMSLEELDDSPESVTIAAVKQMFPADAKAPTLIEAASGRHIIGFHLGAGADTKGVPIYDSHLMIVDREGKILFEDTTDRRVYTALQDFYFVVNEELIYVRNSNEIVAVKLG